MVFNILQFQTEAAEVAYWKNLAHQRGEALEEQTRVNELMLSSANRIETEVDELRGRMSSLELRVEDQGKRLDQIEMKKNIEFRHMQRQINKLQRDVAILQQKSNPREKQPWK